MGHKMKLKTLVHIFRILTNFKINISQRSVATHLRCGGIFSNHLYCIFSTECACEKILKIGQYLVKIWTKVCGLLFWATLLVCH